MKPSFSIRNGTAADEARVLAMNGAALQQVGPLTAAELEALTALPGCYRVADAGGSAVGYLIAVAPEADFDGDEFLWLRRNFPGSLYIDQVAVDSGWRRKGVGGALYRAAEECARERGLRRLGCEVNLQPANPGSLHFHRAMGFQQAGTLRVPDGRFVSLQLREVTPAARRR